MSNKQFPTSVEFKLKKKKANPRFLGGYEDTQ